MRHQPAPDNSTNTVLIVVGAVLGVLLLLGLGCGLGVYFMVRSISNAAQGIAAKAQEGMAEIADTDAAATNFLNDVSANRLDAAYASGSTGFRARQTKEELRAFLNQNPLVKQRGGAAQHFIINQAAGNRYTYQYTLDQRQQTTCTVQVVKEDGRWCVDSISVP